MLSGQINCVVVSQESSHSQSFRLDARRTGCKGIYVIVD